MLDFGSGVKHRPYERIVYANHGTIPMLLVLFFLSAIFRAKVSGLYFFFSFCEKLNLKKKRIFCLCFTFISQQCIKENIFVWELQYKASESKECEQYIIYHLFLDQIHWIKCPISLFQGLAFTWVWIQLHIILLLTNYLSNIFWHTIFL